MAAQEGQALRRFLRRGIAIVRRAPVDDIGDVGVGVAVQPDAGQHLVQQLPGAADKGLADAVFVAARRFADEHDAARRRAVGEDGVGGGALEGAAVEGFQRRLEFRQAGGRRRRGHGVADGVAVLADGAGGAAGRGAARRGGAGRGSWRRRRLGHQPVDRRLADGLVGAGFDQPVQGGQRVLVLHAAIVGCPAGC